MATYSTKYNIGDEVFVFQPSARYATPTLMKTTVTGIEIKTFDGRAGVYYHLTFVSELVPQCDVFLSIEKALNAVRIED